MAGIKNSMCLCIVVVVVVGTFSIHLLIITSFGNLSSLDSINTPYNLLRRCFCSFFLT